MQEQGARPRAETRLESCGSRLGCGDSGGSRARTHPPHSARVPSRAWVMIASRRASTAGNCRPLASCRTSTGPSDTWGQETERGEAHPSWQLG